MFGHKQVPTLPLRVFRHDGYWEVRRGQEVVERFVVLEDVLRYLERMRAEAA